MITILTLMQFLVKVITCYIKAHNAVLFMWGWLSLTPITLCMYMYDFFAVPYVPYMYIWTIILYVFIRIVAVATINFSQITRGAIYIVV